MKRHDSSAVTTGCSIGSLWLLLAIGGCGSDGNLDDSSAGLAGSGADQAGDLALEVTAGSMGFDPSQVEIHGDMVIIEGDMAVSLETFNGWNDELVPKGYYHNNINPPNVSDVCVQLIPAAFADSGQDMPFFWAWAFLFATFEWNDRTDVNLRWAPFLETDEATAAQRARYPMLPWPAA